MIKLFEEYKREPQIGDFIIDKDFEKFNISTEEDIGEIIDIDDTGKFIVRYGKPHNVKFSCDRENILYFGTKEKMKEIVRTEMSARKYNL